MKKINWKDGLISLGIIGVVVGGSAYLNYTQNQVDPATKAIHDRTEQDLSYMNAKAADINSDTIADDKSNDITVAPDDGTGKIKIVDNNNDSPFVDDSYMNTPVDKSDAPKQDPQIGDTISDVDNSTWGRAGDITTTKTANGESQLWIYQNGRSLFFQDGVLESITQ